MTLLRIVFFMIILIPAFGFSEETKAELRSICLPKPFRVVYSKDEGSPLGMGKHPFQYGREQYEGKVTVQLDSGKEFDLSDKPGLKISGVDPQKSYIVRYRVNGKAIREFRVKFEDVNYDLVIDQGAYYGEFRTLPPKNKCRFKDTESI